MYSREDTIRSDRGSELGRKTVGFQDPVSDMDQVVDVRMQHAFTKAVLDQLEANGTDVRRHHRKQRKKQYTAVPAIEYCRHRCSKCWDPGPMGTYKTCDKDE